MSGAMQTELRDTPEGVTFQLGGEKAELELGTLMNAMKEIGVDIPNTVATNVAEELVTKTPSVAEVVATEKFAADNTANIKPAPATDEGIEQRSSEEQYGNIGPSFAFNNDDPIKTEGNSRSV